MSRNGFVIIAWMRMTDGMICNRIFGVVTMSKRIDIFEYLEARQRMTPEEKALQDARGEEANEVIRQDAKIRRMAKRLGLIARKQGGRGSTKQD